MVTSSFNYTLECNDSVCCNDMTDLPDNIVLTFNARTRYYHRIFYQSVATLLRVAVKKNGNDYAFSVKYSGRNAYQLHELAGLTNSEKCVWNTYVRGRLVPQRQALNCHLFKGDEVSFSFEEVATDPILME